MLILFLKLIICLEIRKCRKMVNDCYKSVFWGKQWTGRNAKSKERTSNSRDIYHDVDVKIE